MNCLTDTKNKHNPNQTALVQAYYKRTPCDVCMTKGPKEKIKKLLAVWVFCCPLVIQPMWHTLKQCFFVTAIGGYLPQTFCKDCKI